MRMLLVTGGTGKLGRVLVSHFLGQGHHVVFTGRSHSSLEAVKAEHAGAGDRLLGVTVDLVAEDAVGRLTDELRALGIIPDGLVNNARSHDFLKLGADGLVARRDFLGELLVDVVAPYELTMALSRLAGEGLRAVVNIGSQYGSVAANPALYQDPQRQSFVHYSVAKAALAHLTRELAVRLAGQGTRVNCIAFGGVEGRADSAFMERYGAMVPAGRMLRESEVAGPVDYLLSEASSGMTGQVVAVDGGWSVW